MLEYALAGLTGLLFALGDGLIVAGNIWGGSLVVLLSFVTGIWWVWRLVP